MGKQIKKIAITGVSSTGKTTDVYNFPKIIEALGWRTVLIFVIKKPNEEVLKELNAVPVLNYQTYLKNDNGVERRVRKRVEKGKFDYFYTEKTDTSNFERIEKERRISEREYLNLLAQTDTFIKPSYKTRYCFVWNSAYYECDIYPQLNDKAIVEIELTTKEQTVKLPPCFDVIKEITRNKKYRNYSIDKGLS